MEDYVYITSREGYISEVYAPKLIWTYETEVSKPEAIPGYNLFFLLGILSIVSIILSKKLKKS